MIGSGANGQRLMSLRFFQCFAKKRLASIYLLIGAMAVGVWIGHAWAQRNVLAAMVPVVIKEAGLEFQARLDTGAVVSSINATHIEIPDGGDNPRRAHVGMVVRFILVNGEGESATVEAPIAQVRGISTADCRELRYHVYLTVERGDESYRVLMNLNDRSRSSEKLLLGRNWLRQGFSVDVSRT